MPASRIAGHREVEVEKDTTHCKWRIKDPKGNVLYEVSWSWVYNAHNASEEYYTCIYTAMCYQPLSDADREALFEKFPSLRFEEALEVDPWDAHTVHSYTPPPQPKAEEGVPKAPKKVSFKRKIDL